MNLTNKNVSDMSSDELDAYLLDAPVKEPSQIMQKANPQTKVSSDDDTLDELLFGADGINKEEYEADFRKRQVADRGEKLKALYAEQDAYQRRVDAINLVEGGVNAFAGVGVVLGSIAKDIYNGAVDLADNMENFAASKGYGTGDIITENAKIEHDMNSSLLTTEGKVTKAVTEFAAPLIATVASGGGIVAGAALNTAYNFFAMDPNGGRLSDALKGTFVEEIPYVADVVDYLQTKPTDTEMTGRLKNMAEGAVIDTIMGILWGASRVYSGIRKAHTPNVIEKGTKEMGEKVIAAEQRAAATPVTPEEAANINASDVAISTPTRDGGSLPVNDPNPPLPPQQLDNSDLPLFEREWASYLDHDSPGVRVDPETGNVNVRLGDDALPGHMGKIIQDPHLKLVVSNSTPLTDAETLQAANYLKNDPKVLDRLVNRAPGTIPNAEESLALRLILGRSYDSIAASVDAALELGTDASFATLAKDLENMVKISAIKQGIATDQGRALRSNKVLATLAGQGDKEALANLGKQGRQKLVENILGKYGGKDNIEYIAKNLKILKEISDVQNIPDSAFRVRFDEVVRRTKFEPFERAVESLALNGMLSSPKTWGRAVIGNASTIGTTMHKNYLEVGIGTLSRNVDGKTLAEANAATVAMLKGLYTGLKPASRAILEGPTGTVRAELGVATQKALTTLDSRAEMAAHSWVEKAGLVADKISSSPLVQAPGRVLVGIDTYGKHITETGILHSEAVRHATRLGIRADMLDAYVAKFVASPPENILRAAKEEAAINTFSNALSGRTQAIQEGIEGFTNWLPFSRVITPFTATGLRIAEYGIEHSPFAVFSSNFRNAVARGGRDRDAALARVTAGTTTFLGLMGLAYEGIVDGSSAANPETDPTSIALRDPRNIPEGPRVKVGDEWVSLKGMQPLSTLVEGASLLVNAASHVSAAEYADMVTAFRIATAETVSPETVLVGVSDLINLFTQPDSASTQSYLGSMATRFVPYNAALRDVRNMVDDKQRSTAPQPGGGYLEEVVSMMKAKLQNIIPGMSSELPAAVNFFGDPIKVPFGVGPDEISPFATSTEEGVPLKEGIESLQGFYELNKNTLFAIKDLNISMPQRMIKSPAADIYYNMTPREYEHYMIVFGGRDPGTGKVLQGGLLKDNIKDALDRYGITGSRPDQITQDQYLQATGYISMLITQNKKRANEYLYSRPDVKAKIKNQAQRKNQMEQRRGGS